MQILHIYVIFKPVKAVLDGYKVSPVLGMTYKVIVSTSTVLVLVGNGIYVL